MGGSRELREAHLRIGGILTTEFFNKHKERLEVGIKRKARGCYNYLKSAYPPIIQVLDIDDIVQQIWVEVLEMPNYLPFDAYYEYGVGQARLELEKLIPRDRTKGNRGAVVHQVPFNDSFIETSDDESYITVEEKVCLSIDLCKRLTLDEHSLYINYLRYNRDLGPSERDNKRPKESKNKHYTGWTQEELAELYGIGVATLKRRVRRVKDEIKDLLEEYRATETKKTN